MYYRRVLTSGKCSAKYWSKCVANQLILGPPSLGKVDVFSFLKIQLKDAGFSKYVSPLTGHQALKGSPL